MITDKLQYTEINESIDDYIHSLHDLASELNGFLEKNREDLELSTKCIDFTNKYTMLEESVIDIRDYMKNKK